LRPLLPLLPRSGGGVVVVGGSLCHVGDATRSNRSVAAVAVAVAVDAHDVFRGAEASAAQVTRQGHLITVTMKGDG
jgi:hypothetical protein